MDDPVKRGWRRKIEPPTSLLAGVLLFRHSIRPATAYKPPLSVPIRVIRGSISSGFPDHQDQLAGHNPETLPFRDLYPEEVWIFVFS